MNRLLTILIMGLSAQVLCADVWEDLSKYKMGSDANPPPVAINELIVKTPAEQMAAIEDKLIAVVESNDSTPDAKWFACRMLQRVGTEKCVPTLSKLLCDDTLSHYARLKLERMPDSKLAGNALVTALDKAPDKIKVGIIGSIADRGDESAVGAITKYSASANASLAAAALQALGKIGGKEAMKVLSGVKPGSVATVNSARIYALLRAAESVKDDGAIEEIYKSEKTDEFRSAAMASMTRVDEAKAAKMVAESLCGESNYMFESALTLLSEVKGKKITAAAVAAVKDLPEAMKPALVNVLGWRGDTSALSTVQQYVGSKDDALCSAAVAATAQLGNGDSVKVLLALAKGDMKGSVVNAVSRMTDAGVDGALISALGDSALCVAAAEVLALRQTNAAIPELKKLAVNENEDIRKAAWSSIGEVAGTKDLNDLLKISLGMKDRKVPSYEVDAIKKICSGADDKNEAIRAVGAYYDSSDDSIKMFILDIAAVAGGRDGVKYAQSALASDNADLRLQAVRALSVWVEHGHVCDILLDLAKSAPESKIKIMALRGYINHSRNEGNKKKCLEMLNNAKELATRPEEKKLIIAAADKWREPFVIPVLFSFVNDPDVAMDARRSMLDKTRRFREKKQITKEVTDTLELIVNDPSSDKGMVNKAKEELKQIKK